MIVGSRRQRMPCMSRPLWLCCYVGCRNPVALGCEYDSKLPNVSAVTIVGQVGIVALQSLLSLVVIPGVVGLIALEGLLGGLAVPSIPSIRTILNPIMAPFRWCTLQACCEMCKGKYDGFLWRCQQATSPPPLWRVRKFARNYVAK